MDYVTNFKNSSIYTQRDILMQLEMQKYKIGQFLNITSGLINKHKKLKNRAIIKILRKSERQFKKKQEVTERVLNTLLEV
jgi:hypothetical protein